MRVKGLGMLSLVMMAEPILAVNTARNIEQSDGQSFLGCTDTENIYASVLENLKLPHSVLSSALPNIPTVAVSGLDGKPILKPLEEHSAIWQLGWSGKPPSADLVHRWYLGVSTPSRPCTGDGSHRSESNTLTGQSSKAYSQANLALDLRIGKPVLNHTKTHALLLYSILSDRLEARVGLIHLKRSGVHWEEVGSHIISES